MQLVVVGRHEDTPLVKEHSMMGSVGMQIAYRCAIDVLIVP
jgi:hypothetical protein